jgi:hypothetical protein
MKAFPPSGQALNEYLMRPVKPPLGEYAWDNNLKSWKITDKNFCFSPLLGFSRPDQVPD